ncbi:MAG: succinylglutamate desuccinylase [Oscillospiraceae bacterium]|nr:succinylglutamate desuccinylase [Oscillospiraceae bacterium]
MKKQVLFQVETPYREALDVTAYQFGGEEKSVAVVGALRGNEIQQMYTCALLIRTLKRLEEEHRLSSACGILVVPCVNHFSMNIGRRFWAVDNTDINRMFPGYSGGETTQRIAASLFEVISPYQYGIQFASFYLPGDFLPHCRMMDTGYQNLQDAADFGLPYIILRKPQPYDTTTLNYNWQIWNTSAVSLYTKETDCVDEATALQAVNATLRFLSKRGFLLDPPTECALPNIVQEEQLITVLSQAGGIFVRKHVPGDQVARGEVLAEVLDTGTAEIKSQVLAPAGGQVFFSHKAQLIGEHEVAFRLI